MRKSSINMTLGQPLPLIFRFMLPILIGQVFQNLYTSVDSAVVGNFIGRDALAAVNASADISMLIVGFFTGLSTGAGVLFSRYFGAGKYEDLHKSIHTSLLFSLILGVSMAAVGVLLTPFLLRIVDCPAEVYPSALSYLRIYFVGVLFTSIYNIGAGVLRAVGDSKNPLYYLIISSVTNILLDLLFVGYMGMDVDGVAIATILSQVISVILVFRNMLLTNDVYKLVPKDLKIDPYYLKETINLGLPAAIQTGLLGISNLLVTRYINGFGAAAMAGMGSAKKVDKFVGMIAQSIGLAVTTYVSQNNGAGRLDRAMGGIRTCLLLCIGIMLVPGILLYIYTGNVLRIFTSDPESLAYGVNMTRTMLPFYIFLCINQVYSGAVRGFGHSKAVMVLSLLGMIGMRQLWLAVSMSVAHAVWNVYISIPLGWAFSGLFVLVYYYLRIRPTLQPAPQ